MEKAELMKVYAELDMALRASYQVRDSIHLLVNGYEIGIPSNSLDYLAKIDQWLREAKQCIEEELVI